MKDNMKENEPEEDINLICAEKVLPVVEGNSADERHHPVLSRPESLMGSQGEEPSPKSSNFHNASKPDASASDFAWRVRLCRLACHLF
jgi:hypothetical protein